MSCIIICCMIKESQGKGAEERQNKREVYKMQKLQESEEIYFCECGKNYLTFSALYLHARNKHNVKLTTKRNNQNCKIQPRGDKTHITYFTLHQSSSSSPQMSTQKKNLPQNQNSSNSSPLPPTHQQLLDLSRLSPFQADIFVRFRDYFDALVEQGVSEEYDPEADITFFFNQFVLVYFPRGSRSGRQPMSQNEVEACLMAFYEWLKEGQLTKYEMVYTPSRTYRFPC